MTTPRYPTGCAAGSQVQGQAAPDASDPACAWFVNFNNGNANINHRNNTGYALAVRRVAALPGEYEGAVPLQSLYRAWDAARAQKSSWNQSEFEGRALDEIEAIQQALLSLSWKPGPALCFTANQPKAREIHAPDFRDRVVHHWMLPQLEAVFEPGLYAHSYANRRGKGSHAAVRTAQTYIRQVHSGQGGGYYLKLDIRNCFNSIHRPTLWRLIKPRVVKAGCSLPLQHAVHALLRWPAAVTGVRYRGTAAERAQVPPHKRLVNAPPGCGLNIGNLISQFLANVYLDPLDQFIKHELKAPRYLRYVDDFVLFHHSRQQLESWLPRIEAFLQQYLKLRLKDDVQLRPLSEGLDFLGYILHPTHTRVRRRVVSHAQQRLHQWQQQHVRGGQLRARPEDLRRIQSQWASTLGHLRHANSHRLQTRFHRRYPWLASATARRRFDVGLEGQWMELPA